MNTHRTDLSIDNLQKAFSTAFTWVVERDRESGIDDFAGAWLDMLASALQDVRLTATPAIDADSPPLKFVQTHRIATDVFVAARSGMRGGPTIDVLLQVWFDTEEMFCGYDVPLIFRTIPNSGRMPDLMWSELQDVCRKVTLATPCARVVLVAKDRDFDWYGSGYWDKNPIVASDAHSIAGQRLPVSRLLHAAFCGMRSGVWHPSHVQCAVLSVGCAAQHVGCAPVPVGCRTPDAFCVPDSATRNLAPVQRDPRNA